MLTESIIFVSQNGKQACALPSYYGSQCLEFKKHTCLLIWCFTQETELVVCFLHFILRSAPSYWMFNKLGFLVLFFCFNLISVDSFSCKSTTWAHLDNKHLTQGRIVLWSQFCCCLHLLVWTSNALARISELILILAKTN